METCCPFTQPKDAAVTKDPKKYHSFLIRLWAVVKNGSLLWRASLEDPMTKELLGFETLKALFEYLEALTGKQENE